MDSLCPVETNRDNHLWLQYWLDQRTDFHQTVVNPLLIRFWSSLEEDFGSRIFVPFCGKSLDMIWLANLGHEVIGVELSPIAVSAFFQENSLQPVKRVVGQFTLWSHGNISILCGDYFSLTQADIGLVDAVYDRAALTSLPEGIRVQYVQQLHTLVTKTAQIFLLTIEGAAENISLSKAIGVDEEISKIYSAGFEIELAHAESVFEADPVLQDTALHRVEYKIYRLASK